MNLSLEVNPAACLFVLGPIVTGSKSCRQLFDSALEHLQSITDAGANRRKTNQLTKMGKSKVCPALQKAVEMMKEQNCFSEWLNATFEQATSSTPSLSIPIQHFLELHKQGALLACVQMDTVIDSLAFSTPAILEDEVSFKSWSSNQIAQSADEDQDVNVESNPLEESAGSPAFLHLCGVYNRPESIHTRQVKLSQDSKIGSAPDSKDDTPPRPRAMLKEILKKRLVVFVGFNDETQNPFILRFLDEFYSSEAQEDLKNPPIMITSKGEMHQKRSGNIQFVNFLRLEMHSEDVCLLQGLISQGSAKNLSVDRGSSSRQVDGAKCQAFLLFDEKQSFRRLGEIIYHKSKSGDIYVRRDALAVLFDTGQLLYGNIITYRGNGLGELWKLVFADGSNLLGKGLVAFGLQNLAIIWVKGKPRGLGNIVDVKSVHTYAAHQSSLIMANAVQLNGLEKSHSSKSVDTDELVKQHRSPNDHIQFNSSTIDRLETTKEQGLINTPSPGPFRGSWYIPTPPKLIKIPLTSSDNTDSLTSVSSQMANHSHVPGMNQTRINYADGMNGQHVLTANHNTKKSKTPPSPVSLSCLSNASLNGVNPEGSRGDSKYLQSIVNLQERISQQLSSTSRFTVMETADDFPMMSHSPGLLFDREKLLVTPFRPPQYCIAGQTERLLDIISESPCVKYHEHKIQHIDTFIQNRSKQREMYLTQQRTSLNVPTGSSTRTHGSPSTAPEYHKIATVTRSQENEYRSPPKLVNSRSILISSLSPPKLITMGEEAFATSHHTNHQASRSVPMEEERESNSPTSTDSQVVIRNSHQLESTHGPSYLPLSAFQLTPAAKRLQPQALVASHEASTTSAQSSAISNVARSSPDSGSPAQVTANPGGLLNMNGVVYPSTPAMIYNPNNLQTLNQSNCCLAINPVGGLSPVSMLLVTPVTPLVQQIPLAVNSPVALTSATAAGSNNQMMCYVAPNGLIAPFVSGGTPSSTNLAKEQILSPQNPSSETDQPESRQTTSSTKGTQSQPVAVDHNSPSSALPVSYNNCHVRTCVGASSSAQNELSLPPTKRPRLDTNGHSDTGKRFQDNTSNQHVIRIKKEVNSITDDGIAHKTLTTRRSVGSQVSFEANGVTSEEKKQLDSKPEEAIDTPPSHSSYTTVTSEGSVQLWIFLLDLLLSPQHRQIVHWTGNGYEFRIAHPAGLARLWGKYRNRPQMTYEKMSRALRYYYGRGILASVKGRKQTFRFTLDLHKYVAGHKNESTLAYLESKVTST